MRVSQILAVAVLGLALAGCKDTFAELVASGSSAIATGGSGGATAAPSAPAATAPAAEPAKPSEAAADISKRVVCEWAKGAGLHTLSVAAADTKPTQKQLAGVHAATKQRCPELFEKKTASAG